MTNQLIKNIECEDFYQNIIKFEPNINNLKFKTIPDKNLYNKCKIIGFYGSQSRGKTFLLERLFNQYENIEFLEKYFLRFDNLYKIKELKFKILQYNEGKKSTKKEAIIDYINKVIENSNKKIDELYKKFVDLGKILDIKTTAPFDKTETPLSINIKSTGNLILLDIHSKDVIFEKNYKYNYEKLNINNEVVNNFKRFQKIINNFILRYSKFIIYVTNDFFDKKINKLRQFSKNNLNKKIIIIHNLFFIKKETIKDYFDYFKKEDFFFKKITPTNSDFKNVDYSDDIRVFIEKKFNNIIHIILSKDEFEKGKNENIYNFSNFNFLIKLIYYDYNNIYEKFDFTKELKIFEKLNKELVEMKNNLLDNNYFKPNYLKIKDNSFMLLAFEISNFDIDNIKNIQYQIKLKKDYYLLIIKGEKDKYDIKNEETALKKLKDGYFIKTFKLNYSDGLIKSIGDFDMKENSGLIKLKINL